MPPLDDERTGIARFVGNRHMYARQYAGCARLHMGYPRRRSLRERQAFSNRLGNPRRLLAMRLRIGATQRRKLRRRGAQNGARQKRQRDQHFEQRRTVVSPLGQATATHARARPLQAPRSSRALPPAATRMQRLDDALCGPLAFTPAAVNSILRNPPITCPAGGVNSIAGAAAAIDTPDIRRWTRRTRPPGPCSTTTIQPHDQPRNARSQTCPLGRHCARASAGHTTTRAPRAIASPRASVRLASSALAAPSTRSRACHVESTGVTAIALDATSAVTTSNSTSENPPRRNRARCRIRLLRSHLNTTCMSHHSLDRHGANLSWERAREHLPFGQVAHMRAAARQ